MVVCCDVDNVLANFNIHYARKMVAMTKKDKFPQHWFRHPERLSPVWDWEYHWGYTQEDHDLVWTSIKCKSSDFWFEMPLMPLAKDSLLQLNRMQHYEGHQVYFLTHRPGYNAKLQTERWLYMHGIAYPTVLIVDAVKKHHILKALDTDVFIDDKLDTVLNAVGHARRVYLQDMPFNQVPAVTDKRAPYTRVKTIQQMLEIEGMWQEPKTKKQMFWRT